MPFNWNVKDKQKSAKEKGVEKIFFRKRIFLLKEQRNMSDSVTHLDESLAAHNHTVKKKKLCENRRQALNGLCFKPIDFRFHVVGG